MESDTIFCVWLISLGTLTLRFIHVVENIGSVGLCIAEFTLHHEYVTIYFLHYQIGEHLCLFHFENISSKVDVCIHT